MLGALLLQLEAALRTGCAEKSEKEDEYLSSFPERTKIAKIYQYMYGVIFFVFFWYSLYSSPNTSIRIL
ncbi:MAG: hypothetical protein NWF14_08405, partial [Candidatus Bathyarchaeota archaeon]|nr:hypothetical protein [Candidatus Bathyarchaeota archaeon]